MSKLSGFVILFFGGVCACGSPPEPEVFTLDQQFPVASWTLRVKSTEMIAAGSPAFRIVEVVRPGDRILVLHTELLFAGADEADEEREMRTLMRNLWVEDGNAEKHEVAAAPMTESHFRMMKSGPSTTLEGLESQAQGVEMDRRRGRWVFLFFIPDEATGLKLLVHNYAPGEGQPPRALVDLRR
jgi:hypothetical protein